MKKEIGFIGLGKMGQSIVLNLLDKKYKVVIYNRSPEPIKKFARKKGVVPSYSIDEFISKISSKPKIIWLMITAGKPVEETIRNLLPHLKKGDIIIDGGNSFYDDSIKRAKKLKKRGIEFIDCGVSGGIEGARRGACLMIGGNEKTFKKIENLFRDLSVKDGYGYVGLSGAGHFVKGIHNGIEYGMMSALNEGFEAIRSQSKIFKTDLKEVSKIYNNGSIIQGKLTNWLYDSFEKPRYLDEISCQVPEGETEKEMKILDRRFSMPILHKARMMRLHSRKDMVCGQIISALRNEFGGHDFKRKVK